MNNIIRYSKLLPSSCYSLLALERQFQSRLSAVLSKSTSINNSFTSNRFISTSQASYLKEIVAETEGNKTVIEGKYVASPREELVVKNSSEDKNVCILCALDLNLKHTDVLILSQFVRTDGRILPRRITGLCGPQQRKLTLLVTMAKKSGLMPNLAPANSHKDPHKRRGSKKLNRYFDEATINDTRFRNILRINPNIGIQGHQLTEEEF